MVDLKLLHAHVVMNACCKEETFLEDFLEILKRMFQNFYKIFKNLTARSQWVVNKWYGYGHDNVSHVKD